MRTTSKLGTSWVAPGEGSAPSEILDAVDRADRLTEIMEETLRRLIAAGDHKTNLLLTGKPIQDYDGARIMSGEFWDHER